MLCYYVLKLYVHAQCSINDDTCVEMPVISRKQYIYILNQCLPFLEIPYVLTWALNDVYSAKRTFNGAVHGFVGHAPETSKYYMPAIVMCLK